jgi:hypothetical protein
MKTELQICKEYGLSKDEVKAARIEAEKCSNPILVMRETSKRPKKLWRVLWTEHGIEFIKAYVLARNIAVHIGNNGNDNGRLQEFTVYNGTPADLVGTEWEGKVVANWYPNRRILKVINEKCIEVMATCRDARAYPVDSMVTVDSQRACHIVRSAPKRRLQK